MQIFCDNVKMKNSFNNIGVENMEELLSRLGDLYSIGLVVDIVTRIAALLFICFSTNYRNGKHKPLYYILALISPLIGVLVFAVKRKEMNGAGMKKCPACGRLFPPEFAYCHVCNVELAPFDARKSRMQKNLAIVSVAVLAVAFAASIALSVFSVIAVFDDIFGDFESYSRIAIEDENGNKVYYDRNADSYDKEDEVAFFTKDGKKYVYSEAINRLSCAENGKTMDYYSAYIDMDGYLIEDKSDEIYFNPEYGTDYSDEETEKSDFDSFLEKVNGDDVEAEVEDALYWEIFNHPYYENPYSDDDGNLYFDASVASWNSEGKLIKSESDIK